MRNKKLLTIAAVAGLTLGGLTMASVASAQSYGSDQDAQAEDGSEVTVEGQTSDGVVEIQDTDESETDGVPADEGERERRGRRGHRGGCHLDEAAAAIGIEEADLKAALDSGDTIADVAEANGVSVDAVIDAMVDAKAERIAEKVSDGRITQEQADEKLAELEAKITARVNGEEVSTSA